MWEEALLPIEVLCQHLPEWKEGSHKKDVMITGLDLTRVPPQVCSRNANH
jgi:hypothetical protein